MKRVLVTGGYNIGKTGVATIIYRWGQEFDSKKLVYDYLMPKGMPDQCYVDKIKEKGGEIFAPVGRLGIIHKFLWMYSVMKKYRGKTVHINISVAYRAFFFVFCAKKAGISKIVLHSHCAFVDDNNLFRRWIKVVLHYIARAYVVHNSQVLLACSAEAANWMFGSRIVAENRYIKIFNGLDVEDYKYNETDRVHYRKKFGISESEFVLGNVGRFSYQKNHIYLINVFEEIQKKYPDSKLVLVGAGELQNIVREYVCSKKLQEKVLFLGQRYDVARLLSMMDIFVLTSRFEGLPLVLIEAQAASLPCVVSDQVSKESKISDFLDFVSLDNMDAWIFSVDKYLEMKRNELKIENIHQYSIYNTTLQLQKILQEI